MKMYVKSEHEVREAQAARTNEDNAAIEVMKDIEKYAGQPEVAMFWYDKNADELFGVRSSIAETVPWYYSHQWKTDVRTDPRRHDREWKREFFRKKDKRFFGDHTLVPRGRVFEFKDEGFRVYTGDWIDDYPDVKNLIKEQFDLPDSTRFIKDIHWDIGHGWSDEF